MVDNQPNLLIKLHSDLFHQPEFIYIICLSLRLDQVQQPNDKNCLSCGDFTNGILWKTN